MYAWIWRHLPGDYAVRTAMAILLVVAVLAGLFLIVFPAVDAVLPSTDVDVGP